MWLPLKIPTGTSLSLLDLVGFIKIANKAEYFVPPMKNADIYTLSVRVLKEVKTMKPTAAEIRNFVNWSGELFQSLPGIVNPAKVFIQVLRPAAGSGGSGGSSGGGATGAYTHLPTHHTHARAHTHPPTHPPTTHTHTQGFWRRHLLPLWKAP